MTDEKEAQSCPSVYLMYETKKDVFRGWNQEAQSNARKILVPY